MSPLAHFTNIHSYSYVDTNIYLNPIVLCFNDKECDNLLKIGVPVMKNSSIKVAFREDDDLRNILLKENPKEIRLECYNKEGLKVRTIYMHDCKCLEISDREVEIKYDDWEDNR